MTTTPTTLPVIFRYDPEAQEVVAVFPTETERDGTMGCYTHCGQHATCSREWYLTCTRPATSAEFRPLLAELQYLYETGPNADPALCLVVRKRITGTMLASTR